MRRIAVTPVKWDNLLDEKRIYKRIAKVARPYRTHTPQPHPPTSYPHTKEVSKSGSSLNQEKRHYLRLVGLGRELLLSINLSQIVQFLS